MPHLIPEKQILSGLAREREKGHYKRGLFTGVTCRISEIARISEISRRRSDSPLFSALWGLSRISRISNISGISGKWTSPLSQKTPFPEQCQRFHRGCFGVLGARDSGPRIWGCQSWQGRVVDFFVIFGPFPQNERF